MASMLLVMNIYSSANKLRLDQRHLKIDNGKNLRMDNNNEDGGDNVFIFIL